MKSDYPAKLLLSAAKKDHGRLVRRRGADVPGAGPADEEREGRGRVGELKLLLVRLGAQRR